MEALRPTIHRELIQAPQPARIPLVGTRRRAIGPGDHWW